MDYVPFSQRTGMRPIPPQLALGEASAELRRLINYGIHLEIERETNVAAMTVYFSDRWRRVLTDLYVYEFKLAVDQVNLDFSSVKGDLTIFVEDAKIPELFDIIEFFCRHVLCSLALKSQLAEAFVRARAAYRVIDNLVVAIGTHEQAAAFERAIQKLDEAGFASARQHLLAAGVALRNADWSGSVRESIHAVESVAIKLVPSASTLSPALKMLETRGHIHGGLKTAFSSLYGYTSDEKGVRHALVFKDKAQVDETDALFMIGACASFVSYLLSRA